MDKPEDQFNKLVQKYINEEAASERILDGAPSLKQKFSRLRKETMNVSTLLALVGGAVSAFLG
jgi:hypothetical protein